ncbi:hypothetical protein MMAG44476_14335 [Mycolicibacterium mageritense DSM 44476 = CIP 104973]|uniref:sigma factor-like helix-turn-helix DNA-binding protein n=1 Tax=Mycolicibacterium mageritense TaxID=53462 RepID=UPI0013D643D3|nr:sigma factor-like helix-turn-helix DNA-binding protein [Mycolicibacterium mageritense]
MREQYLSTIRAAYAAGVTYAELGRVLGVSRERVRQLADEAPHVGDAYPARTPAEQWAEARTELDGRLLHLGYLPEVPTSNAPKTIEALHGDVDAYAALNPIVGRLQHALQCAVSGVTPYPCELHASATLSEALDDLPSLTVPQVREVLDYGATLIAYMSADYPVRLDVESWQPEHGDYHGDPEGLWAHVEELPTGWRWGECLWCHERFPWDGELVADDGDDNSPMWCSLNCRDLHLGDD